MGARLPRWRRIGVLGLASFITACGAHFTDLRSDVDPAQDPDAGGEVPGGVVVARGVFEGRAGHLGRGGATLLRLPGGTLELRFEPDFSTSGVPGPFVVLSTRAALGRGIDPGQGDLEIGPLKAVSGEQRYPVPGGDEGRRVAWVYCKPFGVEVSRAVLEAP
jgi:hypothetical protein